MNHRFVVGLAVAVVAGGLWGTALQAQQTAAVSASSGVYTADQAKRGKAVYTESCEKCHLEDLTGGTSPPLAGNEFLSAWKGRTLGALFEQIRMTMPFDSPGKLSAEQYADVLAYIFSANKYPTGTIELAHDVGPLQKIQIDARK